MMLTEGEKKKKKKKDTPKGVRCTTMGRSREIWGCLRDLVGENNTLSSSRRADRVTELTETPLDAQIWRGVLICSWRLAMTGESERRDGSDAREIKFSLRRWTGEQLTSEVIRGRAGHWKVAASWTWRRSSITWLDTDQESTDEDGHEDTQTRVSLLVWLVSPFSSGGKLSSAVEFLVFIGEEKEIRSYTRFIRGNLTNLNMHVQMYTIRVHVKAPVDLYLQVH